MATPGAGGVNVTPPGSQSGSPAAVRRPAEGEVLPPPGVDPVAAPTTLAQIIRDKGGEEALASGDIHFEPVVGDGVAPHTYNVHFVIPAEGIAGAEGVAQPLDTQILISDVVLSGPVLLGVHGLGGTPHEDMTEALELTVNNAADFVGEADVIEADLPVAELAEVEALGGVTFQKPSADSDNPVVSY